MVEKNSPTDVIFEFTGTFGLHNEQSDIPPSWYRGRDADGTGRRNLN